MALCCRDLQAFPREKVVGATLSCRHVTLLPKTPPRLRTSQHSALQITPPMMLGASYGAGSALVPAPSIRAVGGPGTEVELPLLPRASEPQVSQAQPSQVPPSQTQPGFVLLPQTQASTAAAAAAPEGPQEAVASPTQQLRPQQLLPPSLL